MRLAGTKLAANHQYRGFGDQLYDLSGQLPSLDLNFSSSKSLVDSASGQNLVTFTRASSGTYVGSDGLIKTATTNLLLRSEDFSANWSRTGIFAFGSGSVVDATSAPNGSTAADLITEDTSTGRHRLSQGFSFVTGVTYTFSIYAKSSTRNIYINFNTAFNASAGFDLSNGSYQINNGSVSVANAGNGWYRVSVTGTATATSTTSGFVQIQTGLIDASYTGDGTSGLYIWGAQLEQSSTVGEYIPTTSTINSAPRFDHNPTTGESLGLLVEEQRTNLLLQSNEFGTTWTNTNSSETAAAGTAPDGTNTAWELKDTVDGSAVTHSLNQAVPFTSGNTYTFTVWMKSGTLSEGGIVLPSTAFGAVLVNRINLSTGAVISTSANTTTVVTPFGNGWHRIALTATATTTTASGSVQIRAMNGGTTYIGTGTGTVLIWGAQLEAGAFPTSYIPTTTATVTRSADVASIEGTSFSGWFNTSEGTLYGVCTNAPPTQSNTARRIATIHNGTQSNRITIAWAGATNVAAAFVTDGGVAQAGFTSPSGAYPFPTNVVLAYKVDDFGASVNGSTFATDASGTVPSADRMFFGRIESVGADSNRLFGTIARVTYWPQRLPNETLQTITQ